MLEKENKRDFCITLTAIFLRSGNVSFHATTFSRSAERLTAPSTASRGSKWQNRRIIRYYFASLELFADPIPIIRPVNEHGLSLDVLDFNVTPKTAVTGKVSVVAQHKYYPCGDLYRPKVVSRIDVTRKDHIALINPQGSSRR